MWSQQFSLCTTWGDARNAEYHPTLPTPNPDTRTRPPQSGSWRPEPSSFCVRLLEVTLTGLKFENHCTRVADWVWKFCGGCNQHKEWFWAPRAHLLVSFCSNWIPWAVMSWHERMGWRKMALQGLSFTCASSSDCSAFLMCMQSRSVMSDSLQSLGL